MHIGILIDIITAIESRNKNRAVPLDTVGRYMSITSAVIGTIRADELMECYTANTVNRKIMNKEIRYKIWIYVTVISNKSSNPYRNTDNLFLASMTHRNIS